MTRLDRPLKRQLEIGGRLYTLTLDRHALKIARRGSRKGFTVDWPALLAAQTARAPAASEAVAGPN